MEERQGRVAGSDKRNINGAGAASSGRMRASQAKGRFPLMPRSRFSFYRSRRLNELCCERESLLSFCQGEREKEEGREFIRIFVTPSFKFYILQRKFGDGRV